MLHKAELWDSHLIFFLEIFQANHCYKSTSKLDKHLKLCEIKYWTCKTPGFIIKSAYTFNMEKVYLPMLCTMIVWLKTHSTRTGNFTNLKEKNWKHIFSYATNILPLVHYKYEIHLFLQCNPQRLLWPKQYSSHDYSESNLPLKCPEIVRKPAQTIHKHMFK